ncbi:tetratricopeptide repeat protein [Streptomyces kaempferi]
MSGYGSTDASRRPSKYSPRRRRRHQDATANLALTLLSLGRGEEAAAWFERNGPMGEAMARRIRERSDEDDAPGSPGQPRTLMATPYDLFGTPGYEQLLAVLGGAEEALARYERASRLSDLERALVLFDALLTRAENIDLRSAAMNGVGMVLWSRYERFGEPDDLDGAITLFREALAPTERKSPSPRRPTGRTCPARCGCAGCAPATHGTWAPPSTPSGRPWSRRRPGARRAPTVSTAWATHCSASSSCTVIPARSPRP